MTGTTPAVHDIIKAYIEGVGYPSHDHLGDWTVTVWRDGINAPAMMFYRRGHEDNQMESYGVRILRYGSEWTYRVPSDETMVEIMLLITP